MLKFCCYFYFCFSTGGNIYKLLELSKDLQELLLAQGEFKLPLSSVISEYQLWFGKKTFFDPAVYGFTSVVTLLEALPAVVEVSEQNLDVIYQMREHTLYFARTCYPEKRVEKKTTCSKVLGEY